MEFEYKYTSNCIFRGLCQREKNVGCDESCYIQPEFYYLLNTSNIPKKYLGKKTLYPDKTDLDTFYVLDDIKKDIECFVKEGRTLYLWSANVGNGKTEMACKLLKTYLAVICMGNGFKDRAWFEYVPSFLLLAKEFQSEERQVHIDALLNRDFVVLDDIGAVYNSNYDITVLSDIINTRYSKNLATIYTSNINPKNLYNNQVRLVDRICCDIVLELKGKSRRKGTNTYSRKGDNL